MIQLGPFTSAKETMEGTGFEPKSCIDSVQFTLYFVKQVTSWG